MQWEAGNPPSTPNVSKSPCITKPSMDIALDEGIEADMAWPGVTVNLAVGSLWFLSFWRQLYCKRAVYWNLRMIVTML